MATTTMLLRRTARSLMLLVIKKTKQAIQRKENVAERIVQNQAYGNLQKNAEFAEKQIKK